MRARLSFRRVYLNQSDLNWRWLTLLNFWNGAMWLDGKDVEMRLSFFLCSLHFDDVTSFSKIVWVRIPFWLVFDESFQVKWMLLANNVMAHDYAGPKATWTHRYFFRDFFIFFRGNEYKIRLSCPWIPDSFLQKILHLQNFRFDSDKLVKMAPKNVEADGVSTQA